MPCDDLGRWEGGKGGRLKGDGYMYNYGGFTRLYGRSQHNIVKIKKQKILKKEKIHTEKD